MNRNLCYNGVTREDQVIRGTHWLALVLSLQLVTGCAAGGSAGAGSFTEFQVSDNLTLVVRDIRAGEDSYRVIVGFKENTDHKTIIQEVTAANSQGLRYEIVESFDTSVPWLSRGKKIISGQEASEWDIHSATGVSGWEHRSMNFYTGEVNGAHRNPLGFAILPQNIDGSKATHIPNYVNGHHQKKYDISGEVVTQHQEMGSYEIFWVPNKVVLLTPVGGLVYEKGKGIRRLDDA